MGIQERLKQLAGMASRGVVPGQDHRPVNFDPITVRDAIGRVLELGDEILVVQPYVNVRVAGIKRSTSPGVPPDAVEVTLVARVLVAVPNQASLEGMYFLRHAAEIQDGFLGKIGAEKAEPAATPEPSATDPTGQAFGNAAADPPPADRPAIHLTDRRD